MPRWLKIVVLAGIVLAIVAGLGIWFIHGSYFQGRMAQVAADQVERASGLRLSFGRFQLSYRPLSADLYNVVVHGREPAGSPPLAFIPHVWVRLQIASLHPVAVHVTELDLDRPRIHLYRLANGGWNMPPPPVVIWPPAQPVFNLGLQHLRLSHGQLNFAHHAIPLEASLDGLRLQLQRIHGAYAGLFAFARGRMRGPLPAGVEQHARLKFTLWPNDVRIDDFTWSGNGSRLEARGMLHDLAAPRLTADYHATVDLAAWRAMFPRLSLLAGTLTAEGRGQWASRSWSTSGQFHAWGLRLAGPYAGTGTLESEGRFSAAPRGATLTDVALRGLGGEGRANIELAQWRELRVHARWRGMQLERAVALGTRFSKTKAKLPALAGTVSAQLSARLDLRHRARWSASGMMTITPPAANARGGATPFPLPIAAAASFALRPGAWSVRLEDLRIVAASFTLRANGTADSKGSSLQFAMASDDLALWQPYLSPWLPALPGSGGVARLGGKLRVEATLAGGLAQPILHAAVTLNGFRYGRVGADQLQAIATITPQTARLGELTWRLGSATFNAQGEIGLTDFQPTAGSPLDSSVRGQDLSLARMEQWAGLAWPIRGQLGMQLHFTGTIGNPAASGDAHMTAASLWGQPMQSLTARLALTPRSLAAPRFTAVMAGGRITGEGQYDWRSGTFRLAARSAALQLSQIAVLQSPQLAISGQLSGQISGEGSLAHPRLIADLDAINLRGAGEDLGTLHAQINADGESAHLDAAVGLPNGRLTVAGTVGEQRPFEVNAKAQLTDYDIDVWLRRFTKARLTGHSRISGQITARGPLLRPADLLAEASFDPLHLSLESVSLINAGPVRVSLQHGTVKLAEAHIVGPDTDFRFAGQAQLSGAGAISGTADGHISLAIIHALHPTTHASGDLTLAARLGGTWRKPAIDGSLVVANASLAEEDLPLAFEHIEGRLNFNGNRVEIAHLTASTGGGEISISGSLARAPSGFVVSLEASGTNLRIRYQGISATSDLRLRLDGQRGSALLSGQAELNRLGLMPNFDFAIFLANRGAAAPSLTSNSFLEKIRLDVHLITGPQVEVATGAARLQFQADLRARGTLANPVLLGRASISEGEIRFAGNEYTVSKGEVTFANPFRIQPVIDFGLSTTVQQYDITLNIAGPADKLNITYRSDPPLSSRDIVGLLATGHTQESQAAAYQESSSAFVGQSEQLLSLALDNLLQSRVERMFGVTQIQVNPNAGGMLGTGQATVTVAQQISRNLKVTYTQNLASSSQDIVEVDWTLSRHLGITVSRDQFGLYGISFHFRHRAR